MPEYSANRYLLKIFSGPHQGAEVELSAQSQVIGTGVECDLILSDTQMAPQHLRIEVEGSTITLTPLAEPVFLNGERIKEKTQLKELFQFITLGTTYFVIGPVEGQWPDFSNIELPELAREPKWENLEEAEKEETPSEDITASPKKKRRLRWSIIATLLTVLLLLAAFLLWPRTSTQEELAEPTLHERLVSTIMHLNLQQQIEVEEHSNGTFYIHGWVKTNREKSHLEEALRAYGLKISYNVWVEENLLRAVREILSIMGLSLQVESGGYGIVEISGYVPTETQWIMAQRHLQADLPRLKVVIKKLITPEIVYSESIQALAANGLENMVTIEPKGNIMVAKGTLLDKYEESWGKTKASLLQQLNYLIPIDDQVRFVDMTVIEKILTQKEFGSRINIVSLGEEGWISFQGGKKFFPGSMLPNGYILKRITPTNVKISKDQQTISFNVKDIQ